MAITINIYYSGENDNAVRFAEEMISSGVVSEIRAEKDNLTMMVERFITDESGIHEKNKAFIKGNK